MFELSRVNYEEVLEQGDSILVRVIASSSYRGFELSGLYCIYIATNLQLNTVAQWLKASNIFRQLCYPTSEWRGFKSHWFWRSGFEFAKTQLSILNH